MPHYLFNVVQRDEAKAPAVRGRAVALLRIGMWGIDADERHSHALAAGDLVLIYLGAPDREFIGHAELASAVREWTRPRHGWIRAIPRGECCWLRSRSGTRPYR